MLMVTARQVRAARALLGWTQKMLSEKSGVTLAVLARFEREEADTRGNAIISLEKAIRRAGIELIYADDRKGEGVRIASAKG
jgi:predicted transcriptional regulator